MLLPDSLQPVWDSGRDSGVGVGSKKRRILCYVTDRSTLASNTACGSSEMLLSTIEAAAAAGVDWIQLREKDLSGKECASLTREALLRVTRAGGVVSSVSSRCRIFVNDRLDVALAERAGGVHLGENSLPPSEAQRMSRLAPVPQSLRDGFLVGVSCHSLEAAKSAATAGADYIFFGPVFFSPSKAAFGLPKGLERLGEVCRSVSTPVIAIGGINLANTASCFAAGAAGIAAIRLFQDSQELTGLVRVLRATSD